MDVAARLAARGLDAHALTRGYGGTAFGPQRVMPEDDPHEVGDEALLLARNGPTWVADDRVRGCREAVNAGAGAIVFDDGFQDPTVARDLSLIVVDGGYGFGNGRMIPAGPLRETVPTGLRRADAVVLIGEDRCDVERAVGGRTPILRARSLLGPTVETLKRKPVLAFAGIGRPEKFFDDLSAAGLDVAGQRAFADHHHFDDRELQALQAGASEKNAVLVCTEKDWVRLSNAWRDRVTPVSMSLAWDDPAALETLLDKAQTKGGDRDG